MRTIAFPSILVILTQLITSLVEGLLGLRIALKLLGASTSAPFVNWVYETTQPLLAPFQGMFPSPQVTGGFVIEFSSLFAVMVYAFIGYFLAELVDTLVYYSDRRER